MSNTPRTDKIAKRGPEHATFTEWAADLLELARKLERELVSCQTGKDNAMHERDVLRSALADLRGIIIEDDGEDNPCWGPRYRAYMERARLALSDNALALDAQPDCGWDNCRKEGACRGHNRTVEGEGSGAVSA